MTNGGLPGLAARRPVSVLMTLAALLVVGAVANEKLPVQLLPSGFSPPFMWVSIGTLPAAPADNEREVAEPVEDALATLPGLESLRSYIRSTEVDFRVVLESKTDSDVAYAQVRDRLDRVLPTLPDGVRQAFIWRHDPNNDPVFILGVTYPDHIEDPHRTLRDHLLRPLERLPGISQVRLRGVHPTALRIEIDDGLARSHHIDLGQLVQQLRRDNFNLAVGAIEENQRRILVRALSRFEDLDQIRAVPVAEGVVLSDIARVFFGTDPEPEIHRIDGAPAATIMVYKEATANTIETSARVAEAIAERLRTEPALAGFGAEPFFDQGRYIQQSITELKHSALYGGLIAIAMLFLFLRTVGMTLLITVAIPLCLLATLVVLFFLGDSLNVLSMMGLMLSVGMVVDNAIVSLENIDRHRRMGTDKVTAAVTGAQEVALAITLATLTTLVVFLPMILLGDSPMISFYLGKIGFPVCYALLASLFVALVYIPSGAAILPQIQTKPLGRIFRWFQSIYAGLLRWILTYRLAAFLIILAIIVSTSYPADRIKRVDSVQAGLDSVRIHLRGPPNGNHAELDTISQQLEKQLIARKGELDIRAVLARRGYSPEHVIVQVFLVDITQRTVERDDALAEMRKLLPKRPGYKARIGWRGGGNNSEGGLALQVTGPDTGLATKIAEDVAYTISRLPGVDSAHLEEPDTGNELRYLIERESAGRAGISAVQIGGAIDYTLRGRRLRDFHGSDGDIEMHIELQAVDRESTDQLDHLPIRPQPDAPATPLALITHAVRAPGYAKITRRDRKTTVTVQVTGDEDTLFKTLAAEVPHISTPPGYRVDFGERFRRRDENEEGGFFAIQIAIALVFFLMGVLFESFILPFSILLSIPLAFCGVYWTLYLTGTPMDIMALIGCIILVGVVVNNGIVLIDQVQQRRTDGASRTDALVASGRSRLRPILMTALTTIGGLLPMALGSASLLGIEYYPLGRVVIGGLLSGTVLTLLAVPLTYALLDDLRSVPRRVRGALAK